MSAKATVLTSQDIHAHNTFEQQNAVHPKEAVVQTQGRVLHFDFPPASVVKLEIELT